MTEEKEIPYWPYCKDCHSPYQFSKEEPIAHCKCGQGEWGYPRPYSWVPNPLDVEERMFKIESILRDMIALCLRVCMICPYRIPKILYKLHDVWAHNPDLRLGQLISNMKLRAIGTDVYHTEDAKLEKELTKELIEQGYCEVF